jgi:hypothetical protein
MNVILTAIDITVDFIMVLCAAFVILFIALAYFEPMTLDMLAHQAHEVVPVAIDSIINFIKNLF